MNVKELKLWLAGIPDEFDTCDVVWKTIAVNPEDETTWVVTDDAIAISGIEPRTNEMYFASMESAAIILTAQANEPIAEPVPEGISTEPTEIYVIDEQPTETGCGCVDCDCKKQ